MKLESTEVSGGDVAGSALRKISRRIPPFTFLLFIVAYLDRANIAFAKLAMGPDLGLSEAAFGLGAGLFYLGYVVLEVPGVLLMMRWGARRWFTRILISWGLCTVLLGFVRTPAEFYLFRFLLGAAEASFFPCMVVYLTAWFPPERRAKATGWFLVAIPTALVIGSPISGYLLSIAWLGLPGWRWMFLLEGLPALLLAVVTWFYLPDRPSEAGWLSKEERDWLSTDFETRSRRAALVGGLSVWEALRRPEVILLASALFFANFSNGVIMLWLPTMVQRASGFSASASAMISGVPFAAGLISIPLAGWSSDRTQERALHSSLPILFSGVFFALTAIPGQSLGLILLLLFLTSAAKYAWPPSFWALPAVSMPTSVGGAAVGFVNSVGNVGSFAGPALIGYLLTKGRSFSLVVVFVSGCLVAASALTLAASRRRTTA